MPEARHDRDAPVHPLDDVLPGEARVLEAAEESLAGHRRGLRGLWPFLGPAFIACVAYVDPGNFATNMAGGAQFGYLLLWVVLAANLMAMLDPVDEREARDRDRHEPARGVPRAVPAARSRSSSGSRRR